MFGIFHWKSIIALQYIHTQSTGQIDPVDPQKPGCQNIKLVWNALLWHGTAQLPQIPSNLWPEPSENTQLVTWYCENLPHEVSHCHPSNSATSINVQITAVSPLHTNNLSHLLRGKEREIGDKREDNMKKQNWYNNKNTCEKQPPI